MQRSTERETALRFLSTDALSSLMTLKMLTMHPDSCATTVLHYGSDWACMTELDIVASPYDSRTYPGMKRVVMLDGSCDELIESVFRQAPVDGTVFKVHDPWSRSTLAKRRDFRLVKAFLSYTDADGDARTESPSPAGPDQVRSGRTWSRNPAVERRTELTEEAVRCFAENGYARDEISSYLEDGGVWFRLLAGGTGASVCFAHRNYRHIWEIAGVYTRPEYRGRGYAKSVVREALGFLHECGLVPRYQFHSENVGSRRVAESLGLYHFLTVDHYAPVFTSPPVDPSSSI